METKTTVSTPITVALEATESQFDVVQVCDDYRAACRKLEADLAAVREAYREMRIERDVMRDDKAALVAALELIRDSVPSERHGDYCRGIARATLAQVRP